MKHTITLIPGDGIGLTFWINGVASEGCCEFRGGPYLDTTYFGEGVGIAVKKGAPKPDVSTVEAFKARLAAGR